MKQYENSKEENVISVKKENRHSISGMNTTRIIVLGFFLIIVAGSCLLNLPIASNNGQSIGFIDAFFTATSATCVTGLAVASTVAQWSVFGQIVILLMIQTGGLGFVTFVTMIFMISGRKITLKEKIMLHESLNQNFSGQAKTIVKSIIMGTLLVEGIAAVILAVRFSFDYSLGRSIYMGIFHSVSAFCNAGFDIIGDNSLCPYVSDLTVNIVIMLSIVIGGIGFTVWMDVIKIVNALRKENFRLHYCMRNLSLHSKIVLTVTPILIGIGWVLYLILEYGNTETIGTMSFGDKLLASLFQSVTTRTAGFASVDQGSLTYGSKFLTVMLMFIGGSPGGTAGGVKTVTVSIIVLTVVSVIKGRDYTYFHKRKVPFYALQKALAVFVLCLTILCTVTGILTITERGMTVPHEFIDLFYETASAIGTAGLTTGITPYLSEPGKILIALTMFFGRLGPITITLALAKGQVKPKVDIQYPEEDVMVG